MRTKLVCASCNREIPRGLTPLKYKQNVFDNYYCLAAFKKLQGVYGDTLIPNELNLES
ncbi:MAG TPA: hypothetical protein VH415_02645 [Nitrososphaeraceae archaeon]